MNTQLQNTLTANSQIKSAAQASIKSMCGEGVVVGSFLVSSWGYEQTNVDFYQVVGVTPKSLKLRKVDQDKSFKEDHQCGGAAMPKKDVFIGEVFTRRYLADYEGVKIEDRTLARLWNGKPQSFTSYR